MKYRREIDGLRALAVVPVILFHAGFETFSGGFVGVDVFFVISGYLITNIIVAELELGQFSIVNFYERRARRILPALFVVMLACLPFAWFWLMPSDMKDFSESFVAVSVFASNVLFWQKSGYFDTAAELKPLLHTWSLAVEEQYYVLFPLFLMLFWKLGKRWILVTLGLVFVTSLAIAQWASYAKPAAAFYLLPTRGWELLIGAFVAFYLSKANRIEFGRVAREVGGWLGVALILYAVLAYSKATPFPGFYALVPTLGAVLFILFGTQQTTVGKFVGNKAFVGVGLISYSAYLWHQPLFAFVRHRSLTEPTHTVFLLLSILALLLAYFSWKFVEAPFRRKNFLDQKKLFTISFCTLLIFVLFGLYGHKSGGFKERFDNEIIRFSSVTQHYINLRDDGGCNLYKDMINPKLCVKGDQSVRPTMLLVGDSHAAALAHTLSHSFKSSGKSFLQLTKNACPFGRTITDGRMDNCNGFNEVLLSHLESKQYDTVIVAARWSWYLSDDDYDNGEGGVESRRGFSYTAANAPTSASLSVRNTAVLDAYSASINHLLSLGKRVILIYPVPEQGWNVPSHTEKLMLLANDSFTGFGVKLEEYLRRNSQVLKKFDSLGTSPNLFRIKPGNILCDTVISMRCAAYGEGVLYYYDDDHLTNDGAKLLADEVHKVLF